MGYQEIKLELPDVPKLKLKAFFLGHLLLISWATLGEWGNQVKNPLFDFWWNVIFAGQSYPQLDVLELLCLEYFYSTEWRFHLPLLGYQHPQYLPWHHHFNYTLPKLEQQPHCRVQCCHGNLQPLAQTCLQLHLIPGMGRKKRCGWGSCCQRHPYWGRVS